MNITLEFLQKKLAEYEAARDEHLNLANSNNGAAIAMRELIAAMQESSDASQNKA